MNFIIEKLTTAFQKGALLEAVLEDLLNDLGFKDVYKQKSGPQHGYDLVATKQGVRDEIWKFECKNLANSVSINDIAPKLIWHLGNDPVDRFIIVSVSEPNDYLKKLLSTVKFPIPIEIWTKEYLSQQVLKSPKALKRLEIKEIEQPNNLLKPTIYEQAIISFDIFYSEKQPYSYDYFVVEGNLVKAYTEQAFNLTAVFCNNVHSPFICTEINVITLTHKKVEGRIFRQAKMKGIVEPTKLSFVPATTSLKTVPLLSAKQLFEVKSNADDYLSFELNTEKAASGYYELIFEVKGRSDKRDMVLYSSVFPLHVSDSTEDKIVLQTVGKFYDTPVVDVLAMPFDKWNNLKNPDDSIITFLGPTMIDVQLGVTDTTWKIKRIEGKPGRDENESFLDIDANSPSHTYLDFGTLIKEKLFNREDAFAKILGPDWQKTMEHLLKNGKL